MNQPSLAREHTSLLSSFCTFFILLCVFLFFFWLASFYIKAGSYIYIYIYIYSVIRFLDKKKSCGFQSPTGALPISARLINENGAQTRYYLIYTNQLVVQITSRSALARTPTRGSIMCMAEQLSWVLGWLTMHIWHDRKVHWWPLLGSLSMLQAAVAPRFLVPSP